MEQCDYWWQEDGVEGCDLINGACKCGGSGDQCSIRGRSIAEVMQQEEECTLQEAADRAQRRRKAIKEAS